MTELEPGAFTCIACGADNARPGNGASAYNNCQACGASVHTMFGTADCPPCGGLMTVIKRGTATVGDVSVRIERFKCACGWRPVYPTDDATAEVRHSHGSGTVVNIVAQLNPGFQMFEKAEA